MSISGSCAQKQHPASIEVKSVDAPLGDKIGVLQWNCWHLQDPEIEYIRAMTKVHNLQVVCVQEASARDAKVRRIRGFHPPFVSTNEKTKPIAIFIREDLAWTPIVHDVDEEGINVQGIKLVMQSGEEMEVWNVYIHPNVPIGTRRDFWSHWTIGRDQNVFICGDLNERAEVLGSLNDEKGFSADELLDDNDLSILNDGSTTRIQVRDNELCQSAIDVSMCSSRLNQYVEDWNVLDCHLSDHFPILTTLNLNLVRIERIAVFKTNYAELTKHFKRLFHETEGPRHRDSLTLCTSSRKSKFLIRRNTFHACGGILTCRD